MAYDIRRIAFSHTQILAALGDYAALNKSMAKDAPAISGLKLEPGGDGAIGRVLIGPKLAESGWLLSQDELVRAFVKFCLKEEIALPSRGVKSIEAAAGRPALLVRRIYAGDPAVQHRISAADDASDTDCEFEIWQSSGVATLPDVRVILFHPHEVSVAIGVHLMQATKHTRLELPETVDLVEGAKGLSAQITVPRTVGAGASVLSPNEFLNVMVTYCRSKKIGLPARSPKWLECLSSKRMTMVIAKPASTIAFVEVNQSSAVNRSGAFMAKRQ